MQVVAEANDAGAMLQILKRQPVDILLTDITMPGHYNGYSLCMELRSALPSIKLLALSMSEDGHLIEKMIDEAGVDGFIPKTAGRQELIQAITTIAQGYQYFAAPVIAQYEKFKRLRTRNDSYNLTLREKEIIGCIIQHYSNKQIAEALFISERTVETHRKNIYRKTGTKGEAALIRFIQEQQLL